MLEKKLARTLYFIIDFQKEKRYPPNLGEIARHLDVAIMTAKRYIYALEKKITSKSCGMETVLYAGSM